jgi:hypothetical protein
VFVIGGVTASEIRAVHDAVIGSRNAVILGGTCVTNPTRFVEELRWLPNEWTSTVLKKEHIAMRPFLLRSFRRHAAAVSAGILTISRQSGYKWRPPAATVPIVAATLVKTDVVVIGFGVVFHFVSVDADTGR